MSSPHLLKLINWILCIAMLVQPVLAAVPTPVAYAAPAEVAHTDPVQLSAAGPAYPAVAQREPLVATEPVVSQAQVEDSLRTAPIMFIENDNLPTVSAGGKGRVQKTFQVQGAAGSIWLAPDAMWVTLLKPPAEETMEERLVRGPERMEAIQARAKEPIEGVNLKISFDGANPNPRIEGFDPLDTKVSYFIGNDPDQWRADVPMWGGVRYTNLYPGVDLVVSSKDGAWDWKLDVKGNGNQVSESGVLPKLFSFDSFLTDPTPEPSPLDAVKLRIEGAEGLDVLSSGEFALQPAVGISTNVGDYALPLLDVVGAEPDPAAAAEIAGELVEAPFSEAAMPKAVMSSHQVGSDDLIYSTFLGGYGYDQLPSIAVDASGAAYVTFATEAEDFPATPGAYQTPADYFDVYVAKISPEGSLVYIARIGGQGMDLSFDIAVDTSGAAYVVGMTSFDFPPVNPLQPCGDAGQWDGFVTKLAPGGDALVYSTCLGGSEDDAVYGMGIAVDASGAAYVTGDTYSLDFPRQNPYQDTFGGEPPYYFGPDAFVSKLAPSGGSLIYSTYLGRSREDIGTEIAVDDSGAAYIVGSTHSADFPPDNSAQPVFGGYEDAFVAKFTPEGNDLAYFTYLGGSETDRGQGIAVDAVGAAYVTGTTWSTNFPRENPYQADLNGPGDAFVSKLSPDGSSFAYSTYLGGSGRDGFGRIAVDASGVAYVAGSASENFPHVNAYQSTYGGNYDAFVTALAPAGKPLLYSSYLGGSGEEEDWRTSIAIDSSGIAYLAGTTSSEDDFPLKNPIQSEYGGYITDVFVTKLRLDLLPPLPEGQTAGVREADYSFDNYGAYTQGQVGADPINTRTGKYTDYEVDLSIPTLAGPLSFERSYSSENAKAINAGLLAEGTLSRGWSHNYEASVIFPDDPLRFELYTAGGSRLGFTYDPNEDILIPDAGVGGTLTLNLESAEDTFCYRSTGSISYTFDIDGILQRIDDGLGHELTLKYDGMGLLTKVYSADSLRALFFDYGGDEQLDAVRTAIVDENGTWVSDLAQSVSFGYDDTSGDLETVTDVNGQAWSYDYADPAHPHFLTSRTGPNDTFIVGIEYDADGRAKREFNNASQTIVALTYTESGVTTIDYGQDAVGGSVIHAYSAGGVLRSVTDGAGGVTQTGYDPANFRVSSVIDANNHETGMTWSGDGTDLLSVEDAEGNETVTTYDDRHNPTRVTNPDETITTFIYNEDGSVTNPLTGEPVGNPAWDEDVLVLRIDNHVSEPAPANAGGANRVTRYQYDGQSLLSRITPPSGVETCTTYTDLGQPEEVTENCTADTGLPGENAITTYTYDDLGRVLTVTDPILRQTKYNYFDDDDLADEVIANYDSGQPAYGEGLYNLSTRTYRDALGRVYATVTNYYDPNGGDLTPSDISSRLPDRNLVERVYFDPAGRVETQVTNYVGDLASPTSPSFDPAFTDRNLITRSFYDGAGRVAATVDNYYSADLPGGGTPAGIDLNSDGATDVTLEISTQQTEYNQITRITYDAAGRVQTTTTAAWPGQPDFHLNTYNLVSANAYDLAGNVTAAITNYDPGLVDTDDDAFSTSIRLSPNETPVTLHVDPDAPDRNVISCAEYDVLNRPEITRAACLPGQSTDYLERDGSLYNLVSRTYYDEMGRVYATVGNYQPTGGELPLSSQRNFITRTYYDGLGRVTATVANFTGAIGPDNTTLPHYDSASPDRNLITRILYDDRGYPVATIRNPSSELPAQAEIAGSAPDVNLVTVTHYNAIGQPDWTVDNFVGDLLELRQFPADADAPAFVPPSWNLVSKAAYDELGRQVEATATRDAGSDPRVARTTLDLLGRTTQTVLNYQPGEPAGPAINVTTGAAYLGLGRIVTTTGPTGQSRRTLADALGRVTLAVTDPGGLALTTTTAYDAAGRPVQTITENQVTGDEGDLSTDQVTRVRYDALGRATQTTADPDGSAPNTTSATYDLMGRVVEAIDPMRVRTLNIYDNLGRLRRAYQNAQGETPPCNQTPKVATGTNVCTTYEYDDAGHLLSTTLGNGSTTDYEYDALGRVKEEIIDPNGKRITTAYGYDAAGNLVRLTRDPNGTPQETQTTYDRLGRTTDIHYVTDDTLDVSFTYDAWGNRETMDDAVPGGVWSYQHDDMNRLTQVTNPSGQTVGYGYDSAGRRTGLNPPGDVADMTYSYDLAGRLQTVTDPFASGATITYGYDDASQLQTITRSDDDDIVAAYDYDRLGRLKQVINGPETTPLSQFDYPTLDARGNRVDVAEVLTGGGVAAMQQPAGFTTQNEAVYSSQFTVYSQKPNSEQLSALSNQFSGLWPVASGLTPAVQSPITQSSNHSIIQSHNDSMDGLLLVLDAAYRAGDICKKGVYDSLRKKAETARTSMARNDRSVTSGQLKTLAREVEAQAGECIAPAPSSVLTFQLHKLIERTDRPLSPRRHHERIPPASKTPRNSNEPSALSSQLSLQLSTFSGQLSPLPFNRQSSISNQQSSMSLVVDSAGDGADANTTDGLCRDSAGACTLRAAIEQANAVAGLDTITFAISGAGPFVIQPGSELPGLDDPVIIDGTTQPGYAGAPLIRLDGVSAGEEVSGLYLWAGGSTVKGLMITRFSADGITIDGDGSGSVGGHVITGNFIGTDGSANLGNAWDGIFVSESSNNIIGGTAAGAGNLVSGNGDDGISLVGAAASGNTVQGNRLGTDASGAAAIGNGWSGLYIEEAPGNTIGSAVLSAGNLISGNRDGISIYGQQAAGNSILGNRIGTDATGTQALGNTYDGITIDNAPGNIIGSAEPGAGNLLSGNGDDGIDLRDGATGTIVQGNRIGTDASGTQALGNTWSGIYVNWAPGNTIGGGAEYSAVLSAGNLISGNDAGIAFQGSEASGNVVHGNKIGTDVTGLQAVGNAGAGIDFFDAPGNTIGGVNEGDGNLISGNGARGIAAYGSGSTGNAILGNLIGTDATGTLPVGNVWEGIYIDSGVHGIVIGGAQPGAGNLISGNDGRGIHLTSGSSGQVVQGNRIGTDITGTSALGNDWTGIGIEESSGNTIGGTEAGGAGYSAGNVIAGNGGDGILIEGGADDNLIQGNFIGTDASGTLALGNMNHGILIESGSDNIIGSGTSEPAPAYAGGNVIAYNAYEAVDVKSGTGNTIRGNRIDHNADLGIDLGAVGVTANDSGDADSGANNLQNYPVLSEAASDAASTTVGGALNSTASTAFTLDFYASPTCHTTGYGEGATYLGAGEATTGTDGNIAFSLTVPTASPNGWAITATATDPAGNTSEFSACVAVTSTGGGAPPQSTDPIFDAVNLPHNPPLGPAWDGENLTATQSDAYHADFTLDGVSVFGLAGSDPLSESARFLLTALRQDGTQTDLPTPDPMTGNPDAVNGWLVQDNILLRQRQTDLYEIASTRADGVELAYLLAAPTGGTGDLELVVGLDTTLEAYAADEGLFLLDAEDSGLYISGATAIDANGDSVAVSVQSSIVNQKSSMSLVIPGDWLSTAAYPILIDPYIVRWQTKSDSFTPDIAYDAANNRALIAYVSGNKLYARLVSAENGAIIHQTQLGTFLVPWLTSPSVIFDSQQNEYLVTGGQEHFSMEAVSFWRVDADGYPVPGSDRTLATSPSLNSVDIASTGDGAALVVWSNGSQVWGQRIGLDGTLQGGTLDIATAIIADEHNTAVVYDATLEAYIVTWQQENLLGSEISARTILPDGSLREPFSVSDDAGKEFDPDVAYSALTGQTLVVWSSEETGGQAIQARRLSGGTPVSPVFMVSQPSDVDQLPRVSGSQNTASQDTGWVVTWQRSDSDPASEDKGDIWLSPVPGDAASDLTSSNEALRETTASETRPTIALRDDDVAMVALVEITAVGSAIVLAIDVQGLTGEYAWHYEYDDLGRMTFACSDWHSGDCQGDQWQYSYDGAGNLLLFEHWDAGHRETVTVQYVINGANQVDCIDDASGDGVCDGEFTWKYDAYGHLRNDGEMQYTYDAAGRLIETVLEGNKTTYAYNGDGERVSQVVDYFNPLRHDTITTYTLDVAASGLLSQTEDGKTTHYLSGLALMAQSDGDTTAYFQYDGAGSVRQMVDPDGMVLNTQTFDPYGNLYPIEETSPSIIDFIFGYGSGSHDTNGLVYSEGRYYAPSKGWSIQHDIDYMRRHIFSKFNWGGSPATQPAPAPSTPVDWSQTQAFFSSLPSTASQALPSFAVTAFSEVVVEPSLWAHSMVARQDRLMNYDTYYGPYGGAGKYIYVQDMGAQTGDIANVTFATFDAITWWNGIGTESAIAGQALGRLGLSADEYTLLGKSSYDIVRLAKRQQMREWAIIPPAEIDAITAAQANRGAIRYRNVSSHFDPGDIDLGQERTDQLFQKAADIGKIDLWKYVDRVRYQPDTDKPYFHVTRGGIRVIYIGPSTLSGSTENQLIHAFHEITHAQKFYFLVQRDFGGDSIAAWSTWQVLTDNKFVYAFDEVIAERMAMQRVEKYFGALSSAQIAQSKNNVIWPRREVFWPKLP